VNRLPLLGRSPRRRVVTLMVLGHVHGLGSSLAPGSPSVPGALLQPVARTMNKVPGNVGRWQHGSGNSTSPSRSVQLPFTGTLLRPHGQPAGVPAAGRAPGIRCHATSAPAKTLADEEGLGVITSDGQLANYADHLRYRYGIGEGGGGG
jgi:hypothetical protein